MQPSSVTNWSPEIELVIACSTSECGSRRTSRIRQLLGRGLDWALVLQAASEHGTDPLLERCLQHAAPDLTPTSVLVELGQAHRQLVVRNLFLTGELVRIVDQLRGAGIRVLSFKGPTLAQLAYGGLGLRHFNDLDLLVALPDLERACDLLREAGYKPAFDLTPQEIRYHITQKGQFMFRGANDTTIDLHTSLFEEMFSLPIQFDELWERRQVVSVAGVELATFSNEDLCLYLSVHGAGHSWAALGWICDFAEFIDGRISLDWDFLQTIAQRCHCMTMLRLAVAIVDRLCETSIPLASKFGFASDRKVCRLTNEIVAALFQPYTKRKLFESLLYVYRCQGEPGNIFRTLATQAFTPHPPDWQFIRLPRPLWFLYALLRPMRLLWIARSNGRNDCAP